jgi:acyl dehydratase
VVTAPSAELNSNVSPGFLEHRRRNSRASSSSIRFWARTIGERNPRYVNASYGTGSQIGSLQAHPCWLYSVQDTVVTTGHRGRVPVLAATSWRFERPTVPNETVATTVRLVAERSVESSFAGRTPVQTIEVDYLGSRNDLIARAQSTIFLIDPDQARQGSKFEAWRRWRYTPEQLQMIEDASDRETAMFAARQEIRYVEDVAAGEVVTPIVRGPLTSEESTLYVGATHPAQGMESFTQDRLSGRIPAFVHPRSGVFETYDAGYVDDESARQLGYPAAHDVGSDRIAYVASLVTGWMGPAGDLRSLNVRLAAPHMLGETSWCHAKVRAIGAHSTRSARISLDLEVRNQADVVTAFGEAEVELPLRSVRLES